MSRQDLLQAWHDHLALGQRRSPHTVRAYHRAAVRLVTAFDAETFECIAQLTPGEVRAHLAARREDGLGNASIARELSSLKSFIGFAQMQAGQTDAQPPRLRGPRLKKGLPRPVTPDDAIGLAQTVEALAGESWVGARDRAVMLLL